MIEFNEFQNIQFNNYIYKSNGLLSQVKLDKVTFNDGSSLSYSIQESSLNQVMIKSSSRFDFITSELNRCEADKWSPEHLIINTTIAKDSSLKESVFKQSRFIISQFENCDFRNSEFIKSEISECEFRFSDLSYTVWKNCFIKAILQQTNLNHTFFSTCTFVRMNFTDIDLEMTEFADCIFIDCEFSKLQRQHINESNLFVIRPKGRDIAWGMQTPAEVNTLPTSNTTSPVNQPPIISPAHSTSSSTQASTPSRPANVSPIKSRFGSIEIPGDDL